MFGRVAFSAVPTAQAIRKAVDEVVGTDATAVVVLVAAPRSIDLGRVVEALAGITTPVVGAVFPGLIRDDELLRSGCLALAVTAGSRRVLIRDLNSERGALETSTRNLFLGTDGRGDHTVLMFVEAFGGVHIGGFLEVLHTHLHARANSIGGGAGFADFVRAPCLFTESEVLPVGGGITLRIDAHVTTRVAHGWEPLAGPFFANSCHEGTIESLDWRSALDVYREVVERAGASFSSTERFMDVSKRFPLAVVKLKDNLVVRDPVAMTAEGALRTLGNIPEHSLLLVLHADPDALILAAEGAARDAARDARRPIRRAFVANCVSRVDALGSRFGEELRRVHDAVGVPVIGALTLGEIATSGDLIIELYNKTIVVGVS